MREISLKKLTLLAIGIFTVLGIIFWTGWKDIKIVLLKANIGWLFLLLISQVITLLLVAYRWHYLVCKLCNNISFLKTFNIFLAGNFVESVTPSSKFGGEAVRIYLFRKHTSLPYRKLTAIVLLEKYFSLVPFGMICVIFLVWSLFNMRLPKELYFALPVLVLLIVFLIRFYKSSGKLKDTDKEYKMDMAVDISYNTEKEDKKNKGFLKRFLIKIKNIKSFVVYSAYYSREIISIKEQLMLFLLSLLIWAVYPLEVYIIVIMLDIDIDLFLTLSIAYIAYLISMIPLLPGGLGSFEVSMAAMFDMVNASFAEGVSVALFTRLVTYWFPLILSALATFYIAYSYKNKKDFNRFK